MDTSHTQIVMWIVGTGIGIVIAFITILMTSLSKKVDLLMCNKIHIILDDKLKDISNDAKDTINKIHSMSLAIENIRGMLQSQIDTEAGRWDRSETGKKG